MKNSELIDKLKAARKLLVEVQDHVGEICDSNRAMSSDNNQYDDPSLDWCYDVELCIRQPIGWISYLVKKVSGA